jgi:hypothetical protein
MVARHASPPGNRLKAKPMADGQGEAGGTKSETNIKQSSGMWENKLFLAESQIPHLISPEKLLFL